MDLGSLSLFLSGVVIGLVAWDIRQRRAEQEERLQAKAELLETSAKLVAAHNNCMEAMKTLGDRVAAHDLHIKSVVPKPNQGRTF